MVLWGQISVDKTKLKQIITWPNFKSICTNISETVHVMTKVYMKHI